MIDKLTARGRPIVRRIATILAIADCKSRVYERHLIAAHALWEYSVNTCEYVFGNLVGNPNADKIYRALAARPSGLSKSEISRIAFNNNASKSVIDTAIKMLDNRGLISAHQI